MKRATERMLWSACRPLSTKGYFPRFLDGLNDVCCGFPLRRFDRGETSVTGVPTDFVSGHSNHLLSRAVARPVTGRRLEGGGLPNWSLTGATYRVRQYLTNCGLGLGNVSPASAGSAGRAA